MLIKKCSLCKIDKTLDSFYNHRNTCKKCLNKKHYDILKSNPDKYAKKRALLADKYKLRKKEISENINNLKIQKGCFLCGYNKSAKSLLFHHVNPLEKNKTISKIVMKGARSRQDEINKEIAKCLILCFNCHIALHAGLIKL